VVLAGEAALRVGAGKLGLLAPTSIAGRLGAAVPEAGIYVLPDRASDAIAGPARGAIENADAVLVGSGFDDPGETRDTLLAVVDAGARTLVLDAFGVGVLPEVDRSALPDALILNPNLEEAAILLGRDVDGSGAVEEIARRFDAVVNCYGTIAGPDEVWQVDGGGPGLGTSGSGDVLAGAITGFAARGLDPTRAAAWGSWAHAHAGDRLAARLGLGVLARELPREIATVLAEL